MMRFLRAHAGLLLLIALYLAFRLPLLSLLPIFNDEAIYLDWGWRMTTPGGDLYFSLYDNKQPLLMWIFGIAARIFPDPLVASRLISVITGLITMLGIYAVSKRVSRTFSFIPPLLYSIIPIFTFYDRQALMESAVGAVGVWSAYYAILFITTGRQKYTYILGIILGLGFLIKSSALIFLFAFGCIALRQIFIKKAINPQLLIPVVCFFLVNILLFLNPTFWSTLGKNSLYTLTIPELISFPIVTWIGNFIGNLEIMFLFLTPLVCMAILSGVILASRKKTPWITMLLIWLIVSLLLQTILIRTTSQRYLVSYLPLLLIFTIPLFETIRRRAYQMSILLSVILVPTLATILLIVNPPEYIQKATALSRYGEGGYIKGFTSGYGLEETISYLTNEGEKHPIFIVTATNAGNPESAIQVSFTKNPRITTGYLDARLLPPDQLAEVDCLTSNTPLFFVSRNEQLAGLDRFLTNIVRFKNPHDKNSIGIYTLTTPCTGNHLELSPVDT